MSGAPNNRGQHWLVRLYPAAWRERYGVELDELLRERRVGARDILDIARSAASERIFNPSGLGGRTMQTYRGSVISMAKHPSGYVPLILSAAALALLLGYLALFGVTRQEDEGTAAHLYQLMIGAQVLIIPYFALRWGIQDLKAGASVIALQVVAILITFAPLWYFGL